MPDEKLSAEQLTRIYERRIRPAFFEGITRQAQPTAVFVGGQPGAGKTSAIESVQARFNNQAVQLDTDRLRTFHPGCSRLEATDPTRAIEVSSPSAAAWTIMLRNEAIERGANLIYETAMRNAPAFDQVTSKLAQTHRLELEVVATRPEVATARAINRREKEIVRQGSGRLVAPDVIKSAESGMIDILRQAEAKGQIARISIRDQFGKSLYQAEAPYPPGGQAAATIERDRARPLSAPENQALREVWADSLDKMAARRIDLQERRELTGYGPLPATVRDAITENRLTQAPASQALASQILADNVRSHATPSIQQQAQITMPAAPSADTPTNQTPKIRFADRDNTISFDPPRRGQEMVLRLHDAATGEPVARVTADFPQYPPAAGNITVKNYTENAGLAEALARSGAFTPQKEFMGGMIVEMKVVDPALSAELQKREVTRARGHEQTQGREGSGHDR